MSKTGEHAYRTLEQRRADGRKQRQVVRRQDQGHWAASLRRGSIGNTKADPLELLAKSMQGRVPELITEKYRRMALSPF
jgi:hypothetical protein